MACSFIKQALLNFVIVLVTYVVRLLRGLKRWNHERQKGKSCAEQKNISGKQAHNYIRTQYFKKTEESDEDEKEEVLPKRTMTRDMRRTSEIMSSLQIKIDPIV